MTWETKIEDSIRTTLEASRDLLLRQLGEFIQLERDLNAVSLDAVIKIADVAIKLYELHKTIKELGSDDQ